MTIFSANGLVSASACFARASWLACTSNMSLIATLFTNSWADGVWAPAGQRKRDGCEKPRREDRDPVHEIPPGIDGSSAVQSGNVPPSCRFRAINALACRREVSRCASPGAAAFWSLSK